MFITVKESKAGAKRRRKLVVVSRSKPEAMHKGLFYCIVLKINKPVTVRNEGLSNLKCTDNG